MIIHFEKLDLVGKPTLRHRSLPENTHLHSPVICCYLLHFCFVLNKVYIKNIVAQLSDKVFFRLIIV